MPTSGAEKKSVLVRWISVRLNAKRTAFSVVGLMTKFSPMVNVCARLSRPPMRVTSRFSSAASRLNGGGVNCLVADVAAEERVLAVQLIVDLADVLSFVGRGRQAVLDQAARIVGLSAAWLVMFSAALLNMRRVDPVADERRAAGCLAVPALQAGEANAVKSPASIAAVGTNARLSVGLTRVFVPW